MTTTKLRFRFLGLWLLSFVACVAVGLLLTLLDQQSTVSRVSRAAATLAKGCELHPRPVPNRIDQMARVTAGPVGRDATRQFVGYRQSLPGGTRPRRGRRLAERAGSLAYAFPTYAGTGPKTDLAGGGTRRDRKRQRGGRPRAGGRSIISPPSAEQTLLLRACPLPGPIAGLTAWTMTRVDAAPYFDQLRLGLAVLLGLMALMSAWLGRVLILWARYTRGVEAAPVAATVSGRQRPLAEPEIESAVVALRTASGQSLCRAPGTEESWRRN